MPLKKLEKELYKPDSETLKERSLSEDYFDPEKAKKDSDERFAGKKEWDEKRAGISRYSRKTIIIGVAVVGAIFALFAIIAGVVTFKEGSFSEERVTIDIEGNKKVRSSDSVDFKISYENDNRATLKNAEVRLNHSQNFVVDDANVEFRKEGDNNTVFLLGEIKSNDKAEINISGRFYAPEDFVVYLKPKLRYTPSNFNSVFEADGSISVEVATAPISMRVTAPNEALESGMIEYVIEYENLSDVNFDNLKIVAEYPEGFTFNSASVNPIQGDNTWYLDSLEPSQKNSITISGNVSGRSGDIKSINVSLGMRSDEDIFVLYNKKEDVTKIVSSPLYVRHSVNKSKSLNANLGGLLRYSIEFGNKGDKGLRDNVIVLSLDSSVIDYERLTLRDGGHYDSESKTVTWRAADLIALDNLAPGSTGSIKFEVPIKDRIEIGSKEDKNFKINSRIRIDSNDVSYHSLGPSEAYSDEVVIKLNSKVILESLAYRTDSFFENIGPIPPKVGEETSYTMHWKIANISNDIENVLVRSYLPTGVKWMNKIQPSDSAISLNQRTNEIIWNVGSMENGTGVLNSPKEVIFQVSVTPEVNQIGDEMELLKETKLTGTDLFTGNEIDVTVAGETSQIMDDSKYRGVGLKVVQ
ncbi:hypothetical protein ACFL08_03295 [Patescibacteria group bacterium]